MTGPASGLQLVTLGAGATSTAGALLLASPLHLLGSIVIVASVAVFCFARPTQGLWLVLLLSAVHPLVAKVVAVNLGASGFALNVFSAWKEVALATVLLAEFRAMALKYRAGYRWRFQPALMDIVAVALIVLVGFGLLLRHDLLAINAVRLMLFPVGVYLAIRLNPLQTGAFFKATVIVAVAISVFAVIQSSAFGFSFITTYWGNPTNPVPVTFIHVGVQGPRSNGTFASPNELALALVAWALMASALLIVKTGRDRWLICAISAILVALSLTFSRTAVVAVGAGMTMMFIASFWLSTRPRRAMAYLALAIVPALVLSGAIYYSRGGDALIASTVSTLVDGSSSPGEGGPSQPASNADPGTLVHLDSLQTGWALVRANPLGTGLGTVGPRSLPGTSESPKYIIESYYLAMGVSLGWPGLSWALFLPLAMFLTAAAALRRGRSLAGLCLLAFSVPMAMISLVLPTMTEPHLAMIPWVLAALAVSSTPGSSTPEVASRDPELRSA